MYTIVYYVTVYFILTHPIQLMIAYCVYTTYVMCIYSHVNVPVHPK